MVLHMVHPTAIYVVLQMVVVGYLSLSPAFAFSRQYGWPYYLTFGGQYLGAWAVFYSTLLRDAGLPSRTALVLVVLALVGVVVQFVVLPSPRDLNDGQVAMVLAYHLAPATLGWGWVLWRWRRAKRALAAVIEERASDAGGTDARP
jgi:hypothetical protein